MTCVVGPQSSESLDWGPSILNRSEGFLGAHFVTQLKGYQIFDLMTFLYGRCPTQEKNYPSTLLVRAADSLASASLVNSGDSSYTLASPVNSGDSSKMLGRTLASLVYTAYSIKTKAAEPKAGIRNSPGPTTTNFLATISPVDSGDSSRTLASPVHS